MVRLLLLHAFYDIYFQQPISIPALARCLTTFSTVLTLQNCNFQFFDSVDRMLIALHYVQLAEPELLFSLDSTSLPSQVDT